MKSFKLLTLIFILSSFVYARSIEHIQDDGKIIIAVYENFPPYSYIENGEAKGIDIEIGKKIAKDLKVKPVWYWTGSDESLEDDLRNVIWKGHLIHRTKADVMLRIPYDYEFIRSRDKATGELENELVVIKSPYHSEKWVIITNKKIIPEINSLAMFKYHKIGVELDTLPDSHLTSSFRGALRSSVKHYRTIEEAVEDLKTGKLDAVAGLQSQLEHFTSYSKNKDRYYISKGIDYVKSQWDLGVAVRTDFRALSYRIDGVIEEMYRKGEIEKIFKKFKVTYEKPLAYTQ